MSRYAPTPEQQAVIDHDGSHLLCSAAAGAGKTTTIVERLARKVSAGADPRRLIAITYNKSAQLMLQAKLRARMPGQPVPEARTFHSIGFAMMKKLVEVGALKPAKLQTSASVQERYMRVALKDAWKRAHGPNAFPSNEHMDGFKQFVTRAKADTLPPIEVFRQGDYAIDCQPFVSALAAMDNAAISAGICFFDDLLARVYDALLRDPELWLYFANRNDEILVDEFQDINAVQYALLQGIAGERAHVVAIGDCDQSIYGFRGARVDFITQHFATDFSPCTVLRLTQTWRYGHQTALIANHIITRNLDRDDKLTIATPSNADTRVTRIALRPKCPSGLVDQLVDAAAAGDLRKHAMLVRYYSQSVPYEIELAEAQIPFHVYGREPLLFVPEIASLVAALSLAADYWVVPETLRQRFLGALLRSPTTFANNQVIEHASHQMDEALSAGQSAAAALFKVAQDLRDDKRLQERIKKRADVIRMLEAGGLRHAPPAKVINAYLSLTDFNANTSYGAATRSQVEELIQNVAAFTDLANRYATSVEMLDAVGPLAAHDADKPPQHDHLAIMSIHRAKGNEWDAVYLPGWAAGAFPRENEPIEEERRLAYVAVTRAIRHLVFLHPVDPLIDDLETKLDVMPENGRKLALSPFLYDAETGLCAAAADAIRSGRELDVHARRADVLNRYAAEADLSRIRATVPPELAKHQRQTAVNPSLVLRVGQSLSTTDGQPYEVTGVVGDRFYYVSPLMGGGDPRLICLDEPGWLLG